MRFLRRKLMGPAWDSGSAAPSWNRMEAACGLPTTLHAEQAFTFPYPPRRRPMNDARRAVFKLLYQSIIARLGRRCYISTMATQGKTKLVAIVDDDDSMRSALHGLL